ncbi:MAG: aspartate aminotransferase family protein [Thermodesulfobacteriota bacterium]
MNMHPNWIPLAEVADRPYSEAVELFRRHVNPGLVTLLEMGEYTAIDPRSAQGAVITDAAGREILDFVSSYGALNLGHNHPRVRAAIMRVLDDGRVDLSKELLSRHVAFLAHNLSLLTPGDLDQVYLCNSGTEAIEAALKLAARCFKGKRSRFVYAHEALHGKTLGALSVTGNARLRQYFPLLPNQAVPYGDAAAIEAVLSHAPAEGPDAIAAVVLEPIQGEAGVIVPPPGYIKAVREITERYGVLLILDEIQTGFCRTGDFFACQHEGVVPDILVLAKSLGGGLASIGATVSRTPVFRQAYDNPHDCLVQTTTFGGRTLACAAALAALEAYQEEGLASRASRLGERLKAQLLELAARYPEWIASVRGRGLMLGIEFRESIIDEARYLPLAIPGLKNVLREHLPGMIASALLHRHGILGTLMLNNRAVLRVYPPLVIEEKDLDRFAPALEAVFKEGPKELVKKRVNHAMSFAGLKFVAPWVASLTGR